MKSFLILSFSKIIILITIVFLSINKINSYKILGIVPTALKSHYNVGSSLLKGLAEHGHEITIISPFKYLSESKLINTSNWREIQTYNVKNLMIDAAENAISQKNPSIFQIFIDTIHHASKLTNSTLNEENVQKLLLNAKNEKFDVIIMEVFLNEAMLGFGHVFNAPIIGLSTFGANSWTCDMVGTPSPPSYIPQVILNLTNRMNFLERLFNTVFIIVEKIFNEFIYLPMQEEIYNEIFKNYNDKPKLHELRKNVSLVLLNNHFSISYPRPYVPNMIEVGGMHINRKTKSLPINIKNFLDSAKDGAIYFSMGSHLKSKMLSSEKLHSILNTFKSLKQKVLWKWEDKVLPGKPDNVFINDWFPQDDVLAHPNIKLFITHGGLLSITESIYHGVPIIGIPMFADQFSNVANAVKSGFGLKINYNDLDEKIFKSTINEAIKNSKYKNTIMEMSKRYRDQPVPPLENAIYWVEYVVRHKGAPHLHSSGQDLSFIQYHNLDAWTVLIGGLLIVIYLLYAMIMKLINCIFGTNNTKDKKDKSIQKKKKQ